MEPQQVWAKLYSHKTIILYYLWYSTVIICYLKIQCLFIFGHFQKLFFIADDVVKTAAPCCAHFGQQGAPAHTPPPEMKLHLTNTPAEAGRSWLMGFTWPVKGCLQWTTTKIHLNLKTIRQAAQKHHISEQKTSISFYLYWLCFRFDESKHSGLIKLTNITGCFSFWYYLLAVQFN